MAKLGRPKKEEELVTGNSKKELLKYARLIGIACEKKRNLNFATFDGSYTDFCKLQRRIDTQIARYREDIDLIRRMDSNKVVIGDLW